MGRFSRSAPGLASVALGLVLVAGCSSNEPPVDVVTSPGAARESSAGQELLGVRFDSPAGISPTAAAFASLAVREVLVELAGPAGSTTSTTDLIEPGEFESLASSRVGVARDSLSQRIAILEQRIDDLESSGGGPAGDVEGLEARLSQARAALADVDGSFPVSMLVCECSADEVSQALSSLEATAFVGGAESAAEFPMSRLMIEAYAELHPPTKEQIRE